MLSFCHSSPFIQVFVCQVSQCLQPGRSTACMHNSNGVSKGDLGNRAFFARLRSEASAPFRRATPPLQQRSGVVHLTPCTVALPSLPPSFPPSAT